MNEMTITREHTVKMTVTDTGKSPQVSAHRGALLIFWWGGVAVYNTESRSMDHSG